MGLELLLSLIAAMTSMLVGGVFSTETIRKRLRAYLGGEEPQKLYSERLAELTDSLTEASREVDTVLAELAKVARNRETAVQKLENDLVSLDSREKELKTSIKTLEKTPIPVAEHFAKLVSDGEKRGARRDYMLFGAGVVVTTIIAIVIQIVVGQ